MGDSEKTSTSTKSDRTRTFRVESNQKKDQALSVSDVTDRIQSILEKGIGDVWVRGEISNISFPRSGHVYFDLKDEDAVLPVVLFRNSARNVDFDLDDGLEVRLYGRVSAYAKRGNYQIKARRVLPLGEGALQLAFKQLREKLNEEGLFDPDHKRPLPFLPRKIGVVTSATGAAVRDIVRTIKSRFPPVHILIFPVKVQGDEASREIVGAIETLNSRNLVDVIITGRGGGSLEDLWAFNEESVARAIFQSDIPVVSAVGHEVDTTISDLVADHTVPTPTAAGQGVVPDLDQLREKMESRFKRVNRRIKRILVERKDRLKETWKQIARAHPKTVLKRNEKQLKQKIRSIHREVRHKLTASRERISAVAEQLDSLSPLNVLKRGYSITRDANTDEIVKKASSLSPGDQVHTRLSEGSIHSTVERIQPDENESESVSVD